MEETSSVHVRLSISFRRNACRIARVLYPSKREGERAEGKNEDRSGNLGKLPVRENENLDYKKLLSFPSKSGVKKNYGTEN